MVKRDVLLKIAETGCAQDFITFAKQCKTDGSECLAETLNSCSRKQLDLVWEKLKCLLQTLHASETPLDDNNDEEMDEQPCVLAFVPCITAMMSALVVQKETTHIPESMLQTAYLLQDVLPAVTAESGKLWYGVAQVFEAWWKKNLPNRDTLIMSSFIFLVQRTLELKPKPMLQDLKRVWSLHEVVFLVDLTSETSADFLSLMTHCFISPLYIQHDEGIKFLSFVMTLDETFTAHVHKAIKNNLLSMPRCWQEKYGEVYFRTWQSLSGDRQLRFEQDCIQDLMIHAVHAQPVLAPALKKVLRYIHGQKKQKGVDDMLYRLYAPILWRSLRVASSQVRANTAALFFDVFPLQATDLTVQEADAFLQKQFDFFQVLLDDPFPSIRSLSVLGVCSIMQTYWEVIPAGTLKALLVKLLQDNLNDASSADVRESVVKGISMMLDNGLCHMTLKQLLPGMRMSFHDVSEKVRIGMLNLLNKVKRLRTIKYWNIVPLEHLLARLVEDSEPVNKRIMKLIFPSFVPIDASGDDQLSRCVALIQTNPPAARQFFRYSIQHMSLADTVKYITMLCKAVLFAMKKAGNTADNDIQNEEKENSADEVSKPPTGNADGAGKDAGDDDNSDARVDDDGDSEESEEIVLSNTPLMLGLCEAMCILWTVSEDQLKKESNALLNKTLQKRFSYALPEMIKVFSDNGILHVLLQMAVHLPPKFIPTLSRSWLPKLRKLPSDSTEEEYGTLLETLCKSGSVSDVIELAVDWIKPTLAVGSQEDDEVPKKTSKRKRVGFVEQSESKPQLGLNILSYIISHTVTQDIALCEMQQSTLVKDTLRTCMVKVGTVLQDNETSLAKEDMSMIVDVFTLHCKLCLLLHSRDEDERQLCAGFNDILLWADKNVLPVIGVKPELNNAIQEQHKQLASQILQSLLNAVNNMLLIGFGGSLTEQLANFFTACLSADIEHELLPTVLLCVYQMTEYSKYSSGSDTPSSLTSLPNILSNILMNLARHVKHSSEGSSKLLSRVKSHMVELMNTLFGWDTVSATVIHDVTSTLLAAILAEMTVYSQQMELDDNVGVDTLPPLSGWLLNIIVKKANIAQLLIGEMSECCESGTIADLYRTHAVVHLLTAMATCKCKLTGLKEVWTDLHTLTNTQLARLNQSEKEDLRPVVVALENKMKSCQTSLGMVPP